MHAHLLKLFIIALTTWQNIQITSKDYSMNDIWLFRYGYRGKYMGNLNSNNLSEYYCINVSLNSI